MYRFFIFVLCIYNLYFIFVYIFDSVIYSYMYICFLYVHMSLISLIKFIVVYKYNHIQSLRRSPVNDLRGVQKLE